MMQKGWMLPGRTWIPLYPLPNRMEWKGIDQNQKQRCRAPAQWTIWKFKKKNIFSGAYDNLEKKILVLLSSFLTFRMHSVFFSVTMKIIFLQPEFCVLCKSANCLQITTSTRFAIKRRCRPPRRAVCGDPEWDGWQLDAKWAAWQQHTITQTWGGEGAAPGLCITKHLKLRAFCSSVHTSWGILQNKYLFTSEETI